MEPLKVCVTGAAGQIGYSLVYPVCSGEVFGKDQPIILTLLDITPMLQSLQGVCMELQDCSLPLLKEAIPTDDPAVAFKDIDVALLVGAMPRKDGMERKDLLKANAGIFEAQGKALNEYAKKTVKVLVVGNPANTNALIAAKLATGVPPENFSCLTRLDHNRAQAQIAARAGVKPDAVHNVIIWGNHSSTQFPDVAHATVTKSTGQKTPVYEAINDDAWLKGDFIKTVQQRGSAVIKARKLSSALSAAKAICDHMHNWWFGTADGEWVSMGVMSDGSYGIPKGIIYSFPVRIKKDHSWEIVQGLSISDFAREKMDATAAELVEERDQAFQFVSTGAK
eukprot:Em0019g185a